MALGGCLVSDARLSFHLRFFFSPSNIASTQEAIAPASEIFFRLLAERRGCGCLHVFSLGRDCVRQALHEGDRACHWKRLTVSEPGLKWGHRGRLGSGLCRAAATGGGGGPWCFCGGKPEGGQGGLLKDLHHKINAVQASGRGSGRCRPDKQQPGAAQLGLQRLIVYF